LNEEQKISGTTSSKDFRLTLEGPKVQLRRQSKSEKWDNANDRGFRMLGESNQEVKGGRSGLYDKRASPSGANNSLIFPKELKRNRTSIMLKNDSNLVVESYTDEIVSCNRTDYLKHSSGRSKQNAEVDLRKSSINNISELSVSEESKENCDDFSVGHSANTEEVHLQSRLGKWDTPNHKGVDRSKKPDSFVQQISGGRSELYHGAPDETNSPVQSSMNRPRELRRNGTAIVLKNDAKLVLETCTEKRTSFNRSNQLRSWPRAFRRFEQKSGIDSVSGLSVIEDAQEKRGDFFVSLAANTTQTTDKGVVFKPIILTSYSVDPSSSLKDSSCTAYSCGNTTTDYSKSNSSTFSICSDQEPDSSTLKLRERSFSSMAENKDLKEAALCFSQKNYMPEIAMFLCAVIDFRRKCEQKSPIRLQYNAFLQLVNQFIESDSENEINISHEMRNEILKLKGGSSSFAALTLKARSEVFDKAYNEMEKLFWSNLHSRDFTNDGSAKMLFQFEEGIRTNI